MTSLINILVHVDTGKMQSGWWIAEQKKNRISFSPSLPLHLALWDLSSGLTSLSDYLKLHNHHQICSTLHTFPTCRWGRMGVWSHPSRPQTMCRWGWMVCGWLHLMRANRQTKEVEAEIVSMAVPNMLITVSFTEQSDGCMKPNGLPESHQNSATTIASEYWYCYSIIVLILR